MAANLSPCARSGAQARPRENVREEPQNGDLLENLGACGGRCAAPMPPVFAAHVALQSADRRDVRPAHDVRRRGLVRVAAEAADFKVQEAGVERVTWGR
jgi:hypothetical protein